MTMVYRCFGNKEGFGTAGGRSLGLQMRTLPTATLAHKTEQRTAPTSVASLPSRLSSSTGSSARTLLMNCWALFNIVQPELPAELDRRDGRETAEVGAVFCSVLLASVAVGNVRIRSS